MNEIKVALPYIPNLSVNHYLGRRKGGGYYVRQSVKDWMEQLGWLIKAQHIEDWKLPLHVTCDCVFRDKRSSCDPSNLSKVILDSIEDASGINDKNFRWHDGEVTYGEPMIMLTIKESV